MNPGFAVAAILSLITCAVHVFAGGIYVVRPLLGARDITRASRWLNYYCWHMVSILLLAFAVGFGLAAADLAMRPLALAAVALSAIFAGLCVGVALKGGVPPYRFPAASLFTLVAAAGGWGLVI